MHTTLTSGTRIAADDSAVATGLAPVVIVGTSLVIGWLRADSASEGWIARTDGPTGWGRTARAALRDLAERMRR